MNVGEDTRKEQRWKGFTDKQLRAFGVSRGQAGMEVPYFTRTGERYRTKLFPWSGEPRSRWLGPSKPQLPYGLQRVPTEGDVCVLTEGESDTIALSLAFPKLPVLGLPGSQSWQPEWAAYVADFRRVYLSFDGDVGGLELLDQVKADVPDYRVIDLPRGADTRDLLQRLGRDAFKVLVDVADRGWEQRQAWAAMEAAVWRRRREVEIPWERGQA
jgi:hypothetical protein